MTYLHDILNPQLLVDKIMQGYISVQKADNGRKIYNYTHKCQFDQAWSHETMVCRGLITDENEVIIGRPFPKFMNYGQTPIPKYALNSPPTFVSLKMDGSLGIIHWDPKNHWWDIATRGSFYSDQAQWARDYMHRTYGLEYLTNPASFGGLGTTTLVEIIYPGNRIVVDYGKEEKLAYLALIDNRSGEDLFPANFGWDPSEVFYVPENFRIGEVQDAYLLATSEEFEDQEGVVACWVRPGETSFRLKFKHPRYLELHKCLTGVTTKTIWQYMSTGDMEHRDFVINNVPDEMFRWMMRVEDELEQQSRHILHLVDQDFTKICQQIGEPQNTPEYKRKFAELALNKQNSGMIFAYRDQNLPKMQKMIWDQIKPKGNQPFRVDEDV